MTMTSVPLLHDLPPPPPGRAGWPWTDAPPPLPERTPGGAPWPRISIVTPSFNQAQFLEETIRSVLLQGYPNLEYLVIDGGSSDGSAEIIRRYAPWLSYSVSERDRGQAHAINKGFARATGDLIGWINSDDTLLPGALARFGAAFPTAPERLLLGDVTFVAEHGAALRTVPQTNVSFAGMVQPWQLGMHWCQPGTLVPRALAERAGLLDERLRYVFDRDWMCRLLRHAGVAYVGGPVATFRVHGMSKTVGEAARWLPEQLGVTGRYWDEVPGLDKRRGRAELEVSAALTYINITYRMARRAGLRHLARALLIDPRVVLSWRYWMLVGAAVAPLALVRQARRLAPADLGGW